MVVVGNGTRSREQVQLTFFKLVRYSFVSKRHIFCVDDFITNSHKKTWPFSIRIGDYRL